MSILGRDDFIAQSEPTAQLLRCAINWAGPAAAGEGTSDVSELLVLAKNEKHHWPLRKCQFEIAGFGKSHERVADDRPLRASIKKLAGANLPIARRLSELMCRRRGTTDEKNYSEN
jgi:hypothetical protein